ncbi:MAG: translation initiation factor IF-2 [Candidatus Saccharimonadales bacterium]
MADKISIPSKVTVNKLAKAIDVDVTSVVGELMKAGIMASVSDSIDFETASIIASDLGVEIEKDDDIKLDTSKPTSNSRQAKVLKDGEGEPRAPVVAVMGHVDHGKTTLLDTLRNTDVVGGEAGGITQHISAYQVSHNGRDITFLDTPGHEAFSSLRSHGARLTDVAIIVVAADDGIKPQTKEAIGFARDAGVAIVVAINKIDKPEANPNQVKQQLADVNLIPEEWGGDTVTVDISAQKKQNIDQLLDMVLLVADIEDLRAVSGGLMEGTVIESRMITGKGSVATILVQHGELSVSNFLVSEGAYCKVKSIDNFNGDSIDKAHPSEPVAVAGWKTPPRAGALVYEVESEKEAKSEVIANAHAVDKIADSDQMEVMTAAMKASRDTKLVPLILKADTDGSLTSLIDSVKLLEVEGIKPEVISSSVGAVTESDVTLAESSKASIIGFNSKVSGRVKQTALRASVEIKLYDLIYELLEDLRQKLSSMLAPEVVEEEVSTLEIMGVFKTTQKEVICGGKVKKGKIVPELIVRIENPEDEGEDIEIGKVAAIQKEQQSIKEAKEGDICGLSIATKQKVKLKEGDVIKLIKRTTKSRSL